VSYANGLELALLGCISVPLASLTVHAQYETTPLSSRTNPLSVQKALSPPEIPSEAHTLTDLGSGQAPRGRVGAGVGDSCIPPGGSP
jgi:hypothetical protein